MQPQDQIKNESVVQEDVKKQDANQKVENKTQVEETPEQINWKKFREQREIERKQKEASDKRASEKEAEAHALKAAMEALLNKQPIQQQSYNNQNNENEETDEQRIQKHVEAAIAKRDVVLEQQRQQREAQEFPQRLAAAHSDFDQVCNTENLDYLEYHYPEVARAFKNQPDGFDKWSDIYKAVKRFVPNTNSKKEQIKAEKNFQRPQSIAVPGATQTGDSAPIYLDDKRKADNYSRMRKIMNKLT